jgi:hypothetical protein
MIVACGAPGIGAKKVQERSADQHSFTYVFSGVALEGTGVDLHLGTTNSINCTSILKKAKLDVPPRELEESSGNFLGLALMHVHWQHYSR